MNHTKAGRRRSRLRGYIRQSDGLVWVNLAAADGSVMPCGVYTFDPRDPNPNRRLDRP